MQDAFDDPDDDSIEVLRSSLGPIRIGADAMFFVAGLSRLAIPGSALLVLLDQDRVLLDWFVVWGTKAFSIAEHAPAPAAW